LHGEWLVAALGLMPNSPHSAELAYWVRPEQRRRGIALRTILTLTTWGAYHCRAWVSDDPEHDTWHDCLIWFHPHSP
jgi:[ribosomal protein S5]-alanine N-acetyltransferase